MFIKNIFSKFTVLRGMLHINVPVLLFDVKCLHFSHLTALVFYLLTTLMMKTVNSRAKTTESIVILLRLKNLECPGIRREDATWIP